MSCKTCVSTSREEYNIPREREEEVETAIMKETEKVVGQTTGARGGGVPEGVPPPLRLSVAPLSLPPVGVSTSIGAV